MDLKPLTLLADWTDAVGGMVSALPLVIAILLWGVISSFVENMLGRTGSRVVLVVGIVTTVALAGWMYNTGVAVKIGEHVVALFTT